MTTFQLNPEEYARQYGADGILKNGLVMDDMEGIWLAWATDPAAVQALEEAKQRLFTLCDYLFGGNLSEAFFGSMHPFSPVNGAFYCENVITSVGNFISKQFDRETVKINNRKICVLEKKLSVAEQADYNRFNTLFS